MSGRFKRKSSLKKSLKVIKVNSNSGNGKKLTLTVNEKLFADEWLIDRNGTRAYRKAYVRVKKDATAAVLASNMLRKPNLEAYIAKRLEKLSVTSEMDQEWVLERYKRLTEYSINDFFDDNGEMKSLSTIPKDKLYAVCGFKAVKKILRSKDTSEIEETLIREFKLPRKKAVLDSIGKYLGMFAKDNEQKRPGGTNINQAIQINVGLTD